MKPALSLTGLTKRFKSTLALNEISLEVTPGEFIALLGPSGSGKTTLLRMLAGFDLPSSGSIAMNGRDVSSSPPAARDIGMVFQHYALFPHLNVRRNIEYGLRMHRWNAVRRRERVDELLEMIQLGPMAERMPRQLSGGQQQRVAIARALAYAPKILLMDEPLGALDRSLRIDMAEEIRAIHRKLETTFVYVTHDRDEAMILADRILIMNQGNIVADGSPESLFLQPKSRFVAEFFAGMNVLPGEVLGAAGTVAVAPDAMALTPPAEPHVALDCRVNDRLFLGERVQLSLQHEAGELTAHLPLREGPRILPGASVSAYIPRERIISLQEG
ncbi:ABC transporter ATP-binding protein [Antarctobacter sp.]|uniref:ABC transporter ATP-binding protein n=1 Tax=Antarctobacter sp. TaxID=1872577 RepID=UPI002B271CEC|nr:ABC transporter ATP-binding protein [Antarctobacter sp.]